MRRNIGGFFLIALFISAVCVSAFPERADAIPAFSQKYHFSCAVCHTAFPNLNPFGRAFWRNGFRPPGTVGTRLDSTGIVEGLALPEPEPVPLSIEGIVEYQHLTNENASANNYVMMDGKTDEFLAVSMFDAGGVFDLYSPFADSLSFFAQAVSMPGFPMEEEQVVASLNGLGSGLGVPSHLLNFKLGQVVTSGPYFNRYMPFYLVNNEGAVGFTQSLTVGYDREADWIDWYGMDNIGYLIGSRNPGVELYGTPGYHLWYKATATNDRGFSATPNAMEYSYQLKEYLPVSLGQLEFGYYGAAISEPISFSSNSSAVWNDEITANGIDADLAGDTYEIGATYMQQRDFLPYGPGGISYKLNSSASVRNVVSNGYNVYEVYANYLMPKAGFMFSAAFASYLWMRKDAQEAYDYMKSNSLPSSQTVTLPSLCADSGLYQSGTYAGSDGCINSGIKDALTLQAEYNFALNAHFYVNYVFTNQVQDDTLQTGIAFIF